MSCFHHRYRVLAAIAALLLGSCGQDAVDTPPLGVACDPCGSGVDHAALLRGVQSTCGAEFTCALAMYALPGPGVCINASGDTTCRGATTDSTGTLPIDCTYTVTDGLYPLEDGRYAGFDVFCRPPNH